MLTIQKLTVLSCREMEMGRLLSFKTEWFWGSMLVLVYGNGGLKFSQSYLNQFLESGLVVGKVTPGWCKMFTVANHETNCVRWFLFFPQKDHIHWGCVIDRGCFQNLSGPPTRTQDRTWYDDLYLIWNPRIDQYEKDRTLNINRQTDRKIER